MSQVVDYSILDHLLEGCQIISPDFRYLYINDSAAKQGRRSREELLGHTMMEMYPGIDSTPMFRLLKCCLEEQKPAEFENEFTYPKGSTAWFMLKMEPIPEGVFILSMDISEHRNANVELQNQLYRLEALRKIDIAIISMTNLSLTLQTILEQATSTLKVDAADILLLNPDSYMLTFAAGKGLRTRAMENVQFRLGQGHAGRAAMEQRTIFVADLAETHETILRANLFKEENFVSFCVVPLIAKGKRIGVLEIYHRSLLKPDQNWMGFLHALGGQASIAIDSGRLFQDLQRLNMDLMLAYDMTIEGWSKALDLRDKETEGHTLRVTEMTVSLARMAGMPEGEIVHVRRGALLHDIGKTGVPDAILLKPGKLSDEEWLIMRKHPVYAQEWLYPIEYLRPALTIPYSHHEKWDGSGYPQGLKGEQIPLPARLFAIADVWDALRSDRPYRQSWPEDKVIDHIRSQSGTHFDPMVVGLFLTLTGQKASQSI